VRVLARLAWLCCPARPVLAHLQASADPIDRAAADLLLAVALLATTAERPSVGALVVGQRALEQLDRAGLAEDDLGEEAPSALGERCSICSGELRHTESCPLPLAAGRLEKGNGQ
jgi:hypothetical protein